MLASLYNRTFPVSTQMDSMPEDEFYISNLLFRYFSEELTNEKREVLNKWLASSQVNQDLMDMLQDEERFRQEFAAFLSIDADQAWKELQEQHPELRSGTDGYAVTKHWKKMIIGVALCAGIAGLLILFLISRFAHVPASTTPAIVHKPVMH